jgi:hypothetical protein
VATETVDDMIKGVIERAGTAGITAWQIEDILRPRIGETTHQTITGNLTHLIEKHEVYRLRGTRHMGGARRQVYVTPANYSLEMHGPLLVLKRRSRQPNDASSRAKVRQLVRNTRSGSILHRIRGLFEEHPQGLTCREIENLLNIRHQTASGRLSEMRKAGFIRLTGEKRQLASDNKPQPVYALATELAETI